MIIFYILTTLSLDNVWTLSGENCCWSLLGLKGLNGCRLFILRTLGVCLFVCFTSNEMWFFGFHIFLRFVDWSIQEKIFKQVSAIYQSVNLFARQSTLLFPSAFLPQFRFFVETRAYTICSFEVFFDYFFQFFFLAVCGFPKNTKFSIW